MKRLFLILLILMCFVSVQADELPVIVTHKVMVTNKDGTICYNDGNKTDKVIPYKTMLMVSNDINGRYIRVINDEYDCDVIYSDVSSNTQKFDINNKDVEEISPVRAIVLSNTGLNMRVGPSVTYAKMITVPSKTIITLSHKAGTYWYYTEYNGNNGWVTSMNKYLGYDGDEVLINYEKTNIYNDSGVAIIGKIPENTEITNYIKLDNNKNDLMYYVNYNGISGYVKDMLYKTDKIGKIRLIKDVELKDKNGVAYKIMTSGSELLYNMIYDNSFYVSDRKALISLNDDDFEYINEAKPLVKEHGYLGEGIFGEEIKERVIHENKKPIEDRNNDKAVDTNINIKDIIIICFLGGIFILLLIIIIKEFNKKKLKENEFKE